MITEHQEVARYRVAEQLRAAEARAMLHDRKANRTSPREGLASALRRLADRLEPSRLAEPASRVLADQQPRHRRTGLSIVR
ncbi:hypothetical protein [Kribbella pratensis]|uniref:Uncharacterized protein n=1 Tax=Kribbella pratensis TaxID=2512112 RepID=A0A4V6Q981_9ACTN|nr:hypothetical protein [Kribbella pratensis]TDW60963.1 hypothetical protein EV653_7524 [Kribbella pratensis]